MLWCTAVDTREAVSSCSKLWGKLLMSRNGARGGVDRRPANRPEVAGQK